MNIKFKELFPDYQAFSNKDFLMNKLTHSILKEISYRLPKLLIEKTGSYKGLSLDGTLIIKKFVLNPERELK
ncbi:hypothetical protein [Neobacillus sp. LXY-1]|uniref:hypothetical protein n=1 Tax=Neobacillus sp. LXY-1 TaxID=3379133 RepID=UPI003EE2DBB1